MKKLISLLAIFLLVSVNTITPLSYAQEAPSNNTKTIATILPGEEFKVKIGDITPSDRHERSVKSIKQADEKKEGITDENLISETGSEKVRAWYDNTDEKGILYYYTDADEIYMNGNSEGMFQGFDGLIDVSGLSSWKADNIINMHAMFRGCTDLSDISALSGWNTSKVEDMSNMFVGCIDLSNISALSGWNTSNVTTMNAMFRGCRDLSDISALSGWNTSKVNNMGEMFLGCKNLSDISALSGWNTNKVESMISMFNGCSSLSDISALSGWNTSNVTRMDSMFYGCSSLADISGLRNWNVSNVKNMNSMFNGCKSLTAINLNNWNTSNLTDISYMFEGCSNLTEVDLSNWDIDKITNLNNTFQQCSNLTNISSLSTWNTSNITSMNNTFGGCKSLKNISALNGWNTSNVTTMHSTFEGCSSLIEISGLSNRNTSKVKDMSNMFNGCSNLTNVSGLSGWNTNELKYIDGMFRKCSNLTDISGLNGWNTSKVENMYSLFRECSNLKDISTLNNWNFSNVTNMNNMFGACTELTEIDLSNWNLNNLDDMSHIFNGCNNLETIYTTNDLNLEGVRGMYMFKGCTKLVGGNGTTYDANHIDAEYARIDKAETPGYFTAITNEATNGCIGMNQANVTATATQGVITLKWNAISGDTIQISLFDPNDEVFKNLGSVNMASGEFNYTIQWNGVHNFVLNNGCSDFHYQFNVSMSELYPDEFINAYNWAYENGLTTEPNIEEANMYGVLTNLELADIIGKYAENVLNQTPDSNKSCTFDDISTLTQEEQNIIKKACQLGLMPGDKTRTSFNPNDTGNRATFGTALSRAIWGDTFEGGTPYYSGHLKALKAAGIMNQIDNPEDRVEIKGYVLLMLMRAASNEINCSDADIMLVCQDPESDVYENCPKICRKDNETGNTNTGNNTQNNTVIKEKTKSQGYSGGGGGRSSSTKVSKGNPTTKTENNKKTSTENIRITTTSTNKKGNTNTTTNKKQPIDYMIPTINNIEYNEGNSSEVLENGFTRERNNAYGFAYANGITTIKNIEKANLNGTITRAAMAKMLSNYAINVLGKEPDTSKAPHFGDISKETDRQYDNGITLAYQLGIMGVGTKNFRPYDPVTRKEFVTVLSRMLYNTLDGTSKTNYYEPHMAKLYDEGIITKTNPTTIEKRGNVMTMLMRSAK